MKLYKDADSVLWIGNETVDAGHIRARINGNILSIDCASDDTTIFRSGIFPWAMGICRSKSVWKLHMVDIQQYGKQNKRNIR